MANEKKVFSAVDTSPTTLYAKRTASSEFAYPILATNDNILLVSNGLGTANYDHISLSPPDKPTTITYRKDGSAGTIVKVLTIIYSGNDISSVTVTFSLTT